jgi:hypothetical protein
MRNINTGCTECKTCRGFPKYLQENDGIVPRLSHDLILPDLSPFTAHLSATFDTVASDRFAT